MPEVRLVDLDVIKRYSLVVRRDAVPAEELLDALDTSRQTVLSAMGQGAASVDARPGATRRARRAPRAARADGRTTAPRRAAAKRGGASKK